MPINMPFTNKFTNIMGNSEKKSNILSFVFIAIGIIFIIVGIMVFTSDSEKIVDNVLSGETEAYGVILSLIGLVIIGGTIFTRISFGDHFNTALNSIKNLDNIDMASEKETEKPTKKQNNPSSEPKIQNSTENVEEPKTISENIKTETSTENTEIELKNTISQDTQDTQDIKDTHDIKDIKDTKDTQDTKDTNSKPKDYKKIGKNIKSALNPTRIKIKNKTETPLQNKKPKKEKIEEETKEVKNTSVSFDDAMDSIDDLMEDSEN